MCNSKKYKKMRQKTPTMMRALDPINQVSNFEEDIKNDERDTDKTRNKE
jgi:hypothetical protein